MVVFDQVVFFKRDCVDYFDQAPFVLSLMFSWNKMFLRKKEGGKEFAICFVFETSRKGICLQKIVISTPGSIRCKGKHSHRDQSSQSYDNFFYLLSPSIMLHCQQCACLVI